MFIILTISLLIIPFQKGNIQIELIRDFLFCEKSPISFGSGHLLMSSNENQPLIDPTTTRKKKRKKSLLLFVSLLVKREYTIKRKNIQGERQ